MHLGSGDWKIPHKEAQKVEAMGKLQNMGFHVLTFGQVYVIATPPKSWFPLPPSKVEDERWKRLAYSILTTRGRGTEISVICDADSTPQFLACEFIDVDGKVTAWLEFLD
jgi:hypothetical protein